jgi:hypothetical protein
MHKFYTAIYKIDFNASKKRIEIMTRIFTDDLNTAISKKYNRKSTLTSDKETPEDIEFLKKYLSEKIILTINGKPKPMRFLSKEVDENVLICYFNCDEISKIKTFEITNSALTEIFDEQQNIVQLNINSKKQTLLLTYETIKGMLK